jgi:hypothetical protein
MTWLTATGRDKRKCPQHHMWMKRGQCEICLLEHEALVREREKLTGSNKPKVVLGTTSTINKGRND